jgi:hypothetical protein
MGNAGRERIGLFRITQADRDKLERILFKRYPDREWGTFFRFGYRVTSWGLHIAFVDAIEPRPGDLKWNSAIVEFDPKYILRAQLALDETELGIGVVHSHPQGCSTSASPLDDDMDDYFAGEFAMYGDGRPYVSLRMTRNKNGRFIFSGEYCVNGERSSITEMFTVGKALRREDAEFATASAHNEGKPDDMTLRTSALLGEEKVTRLRRSRVGIVGCSGTGSPAAHVLARARVGAFFPVDPQRFEPSNHERFHGSTWRDLEDRQPKVDLIRRMILDINPFAEITPIRGNVLDDAVLDELLRCDIVLGCTDTQHSRAALSDYATHYLLPCIDGAVLMHAKDGMLTAQVAELARYTADEPCAWCLARINQKRLWYELMSEEERERRRRAAADAVERGMDGEQYWGGEPPPELTVGYMTTTVGAMQAGYAEAWITGAASMPHQRFQFDLGMPFLGVVPAERPRRPECSCNRTKGWSDQARADRSVTRPSHWS